MNSNIKAAEPVVLTGLFAAVGAYILPKAPVYVPAIAKYVSYVHTPLVSGVYGAAAIIADKIAAPVFASVENRFETSADVRNNPLYMGAKKVVVYGLLGLAAYALVTSVPALGVALTVKQIVASSALAFGCEVISSKIVAMHKSDEKKDAPVAKEEVKA